jgi:predicted N-acyltransferase
MTSRRRKTIRKERQRIAESGLEVRFIAGPDMQPEWLQAFMRCYQRTYHKRGMPGYLSPEFFKQLLKQQADTVHFCLAFRGNEVVAGALLFADNETLFGRYWGSLEEIDGLHFEVCYYQGIEFAIAQGLTRFDPGTQGEHKIPRGFAPIATWSVHWLAEREIHELVRQHVQQERQHVLQYMEDAATLLPYRQPTQES